MNQEKNDSGILIQIPKSAEGIELFLWNNLKTGPILLGDSIHDPKSGKTFTVVKRTWQSGRDVESKLIIRLEESE